MFSKFNSHLSIGTRLMLMSSVFAITGVGLAGVMMKGSLDQIQFASSELEGARYVREIWSAMQSDGPVSIPDHEAFDSKFNSAAQYAAFAAAPAGAARMAAGSTLIDQVADGSNITLDAEFGSYYLGQAITDSLPALATAESHTDDVIAAANDPSSRVVAAATALARLNQSNDEAVLNLRAAAAAEPSLAGLSQKIDELQAVIDRMSREEAAEAAGNPADPSSTTETDFPRDVNDMFSSAAGEFERILQGRVSDQQVSLAFAALIALAGRRCWVSPRRAGLVSASKRLARPWMNCPPARSPPTCRILQTSSRPGKSLRHF